MKSKILNLTDNEDDYQNTAVPPGGFASMDVEDAALVERVAKAINEAFEAETDISLNGMATARDMPEYLAKAAIAAMKGLK